jgi:hypothetical protein
MVMSKLVLAFAATATAITLACLPPLFLSPLLLSPLRAAELVSSPRVDHARVPAYCDPCGCLHVGFVYHRELRSTYGLSFDPRSYDQTEPFYYFGRTHGYPRYFVQESGFGPC